MTMTANDGTERARTGVVGLDTVLGGGLPRNRLYLIQGLPGVGKTTLALQYMLEGSGRGESALYIALSESAEELRASAQSLGWSLDGVEIYEHSTAARLTSETQHTLFHPDEVDLSETLTEILQVVERVRPSRVVLDSLSELRLLAGDVLRYRREILALKDYFAGRRCTVLLLDDRTTDAGDLQLQSLCHGVLLLEVVTPDYGKDHRRLRVTKMRGLHYQGGYHDYLIETGGLQVFPRLVASDHHTAFAQGQIGSGLPNLDDLFAGGVDIGTTTLFMGPSGTGKSSIATRFALASAERGEPAALYLFDERIQTLLTRADGLGMDLKTQMETGRITIQAIDPAELSPGEFAHKVRRAVEEDGVKMVVIDSLTGYLNAMPDSRFLMLHLHELLTYLGQQGVSTLIVVTQHGMMGNAMNSPLDVSYLADNVLLFRYYEYAGEIQRALSVFKRRAGGHEATIRRLSFGGPHSIEIGEPLREFRGILTGVPLYEGKDTRQDEMPKDHVT